MDRRVVNIGGATLQSKEVIEQILPVMERYGSEIVVVPGGGKVADVVREMDEDLGLSDEKAHWAAIRGMDVMGEMLAGMSEEFYTVEEGSEISGEGVPVLLPSELLKREDPLPHSWEATSDSISAWIAGFLGAEAVVLLKRVDGIRKDGELVDETSVDDVSGLQQDVVDPLFFDTLQRTGLDAVIVNSGHPERLEEVFEGGGTVSTKIEGGT
ncbi:MAG: hypothetical protein MUP63_02575 [Candidatus Nanohaloarchaeota archaeon QJJ-7]|nr:hypothetical protein [Candidatus Nanohaloarchaeota archaeon QJJ-7]